MYDVIICMSCIIICIKRDMTSKVTFHDYVIEPPIELSLCIRVIEKLRRFDVPPTSTNRINFCSEGTLSPVGPNRKTMLGLCKLVCLFAALQVRETKPWKTLSLLSYPGKDEEKNGNYIESLQFDSHLFTVPQHCIRL